MKEQFDELPEETFFLYINVHFFFYGTISDNAEWFRVYTRSVFTL